MIQQLAAYGIALLLAAAFALALVCSCHPVTFG
jgi:hypothetical protein